ncbi:MAG: MBL fold metallo-hydrolase RNA specificity domain-containing protein, partial [Niameybacter sp.]
VGIKDREKDLEKIYSVITDVCIERKSKVLIPIFSLDRCQLIMLLLYRMFKDDKSFEIPIIVDSPLAQKMCKLYCDTLVGDDLKLWREVMCWKNFKYPAEYCDSKAFMESDEPCVALAASGFMAAGRSRQWAKVLLPNHNAQILFVGYSSENALAGKIKYGNAQKTISIDGKQYRNRCGVTDLKSFTSHMQRNDMLDYYSSINCERICLVHGDMKGKLEFAEALKNEVSKRDRSTKIICVNKSTEILL